MMMSNQKGVKKMTKFNQMMNERQAIWMSHVKEAARKAKKGGTAKKQSEIFAKYLRDLGYRVARGGGGVFVTQSDSVGYRYKTLNRRHGAEMLYHLTRSLGKEIGTVVSSKGTPDEFLKGPFRL
jgi:hypothetical protein